MPMPAAFPTPFLQKTTAELTKRERPHERALPKRSAPAPMPIERRSSPPVANPQSHQRDRAARLRLSTAMTTSSPRQPRHQVPLNSRRGVSSTIRPPRPKGSEFPFVMNSAAAPAPTVRPQALAERTTRAEQQAPRRCRSRDRAGIAALPISLLRWTRRIGGEPLARP
jgi:hypothetical protein